MKGLNLLWNFLQNIDWIMMLKCFITGGLICIIGQLLIDKTKLTSARILVIFCYDWCYIRWTWYLSIFN